MSLGSRDSHGVGAEEVAGDDLGGENGRVIDVLLILVYVVLSVVLRATADVSEGLQAGRRGGICVDIDGIGTLNVLEQAHCRVACVVLHHFRVALTRLHIVSGVLEDAPLAVSALRGMLQEVLADRCQVLSAQSLLLLELLLSVRKATALVFLQVFARLALEPELAKLGLDLFLPCVLGGRLVRPERLGAHQ